MIETIDVGRLSEWIGSRLPGQGALTAVRIGTVTGTANAVFLLRRGEQRWVLRRPPAVKNDPSASDTFREWRILQALEGTRVPHPAPLLMSQDVDVIGTPFMIMELIDGFTPGFELPPEFDSPAARRGLAMNYVEGCALLAGVDWRERGLEGLGKPEGFLERQVSRWMAQLERYRTRELENLLWVAEWLEANRPHSYTTSIIHGDYSPFNVMISRVPPPTLAAIVDWDTGTIGDPLLDIGHLLARWTEPGESAVITLQAGGVENYPTRAEMAAHYVALTGRDLSALPYYEALALFKLAVILEGTFARERAAGVPDPENSMLNTVPGLLQGAVDFIRGIRV